MALRSLTASLGLTLVAIAVGHAASAQATLGRAIDHAFAREAQTIRDAEHSAAQHRAPAQAEPARTTTHRASDRRPGKGTVVQATPGTGDPLAGTDATTCHQANGTILRVSGGYRPAPADSGECR